ncbi:hypothetical protein FPQ18DRAFT_394526 [Pyronema domesticum]|nr:hypothetical protein FPQ18DRAFT_394526 [Pyronema domesticum]
MEEHGVFGSEEVKLLESPVGRKALPSHWVFKAKRDDSGNATNVFYDVFKSHLLNIAFVPSKVDAGFFFLYENKENLHATIVL